MELNPLQPPGVQRSNQPEAERISLSLQDSNSPDRNPLLRRTDGVRQENELLRRLLAEVQCKASELSRQLREADRSLAAAHRTGQDLVLPVVGWDLRWSALLGWLRSHRRKVARLVHQGDASRDAGDWQVAAGFYDEAVAANPRNAAIWVQLGNMRKEAGWYDLAAHAYAQAIQREPRNADIYLQIGHLRKLGGDYEGAMQAYRQALACDAHNRHVIAELGENALADADLCD